MMRGDGHDESTGEQYHHVCEQCGSLFWSVFPGCCPYCAATKQIAELEAHTEQAKRKVQMLEAFVPCATHRDKGGGRCVACVLEARAEKAEGERDEARARIQAALHQLSIPRPYTTALADSMLIVAVDRILRGEKGGA